MNITVIQEAIEYLKDLPLEIIEYALKKTARKGAKWDYAQTILKDYIKKGLKTIEAVEADKIAFKNANNKPIKQNESEKEKIARKIKELEDSIKNGSS